jgi:hypothetical protein
MSISPHKKQGILPQVLQESNQKLGLLSGKRKLQQKNEKCGIMA